MNAKIICFDTGDQWTGIALSDPLCLFAKPLKTIPTHQIETFLKNIIIQENISIVVVGNPITLRGTLSEQTKKVHTLKQHLEKKFPTLKWVLWDERLSSKKAATLKKGISKEDKLQSHALAAAFILQSYLEYYQQHKTI